MFTPKRMFEIFIIILIGFMCFFSYQYIMDKYFSKPLPPPPKEERIAADIYMAQIVESNKLLQLRMEEMDKRTVEYAHQNELKIMQLGKIIANIKPNVEIKVQSDKTYDNKRDDKLDYEFRKIYQKDTNGKEYPIAWVMYYPNRDASERWKTGTYPIEFHEKIVVTKDKGGTESSIAQAWIENNTMKETKGQQFPIDVKSVDWVKREADNPKSFMFNMRTSMGMVMSSEIYPAIDLSFFSYGRSKRDMDWKFLEFGLGKSNDSVMLHFSPIQYNWGGKIPLVENLFTGPYIGLGDSLDKTLVYGMGANIPF